MDANEVRRENLRKLIAAHGGPTALARRLEYKNGAFLVQMAGPNPTRPVTEKSARGIEEKLHLPLGALDRAEGAVVEPLPYTPAAGTAHATINTSLIAECIRLTFEACNSQSMTLPAEKFADIVTLLYSQASEGGPLPKFDHVQRLVSLLK